MTTVTSLASVPLFPTGVIAQESEQDTLQSSYALLTDALEQLEQACNDRLSPRECSELAFTLEHATTEAVTQLMRRAEVQ